jgi:hypothetical protein
VVVKEKKVVLLKLYARNLQPGLGEVLPLVVQAQVLICVKGWGQASNKVQMLLGIRQTV